MRAEALSGCIWSGLCRPCPVIDPTAPAAEPSGRRRTPLLVDRRADQERARQRASLVERLEAALPTVAMEIIFVDDSTDGTAELVEELADGQRARASSLLPQARQRRICGLGAAVVQGMRAARAPWVCVMDADLQHPPELIAALLEQARVARARPRGGEPLLRRGRRGRLRLGARDGVALDARRRRGCSSRAGSGT